MPIVDGFSLHAGVTVRELDRIGLEGLCAYGPQWSSFPTLASR